ncbi:hypothetical protein J6590_016504 [Homalodisca vitripennis]|nr:hypothetical protein J6590_016504 [Homalodisca vitripennis]
MTETLSCTDTSIKTSFVRSILERRMNSNGVEEAYNSFTYSVSLALESTCPRKTRKHMISRKVIYDSEARDLKEQSSTAHNLYFLTEGVRDKKKCSFRQETFFSPSHEGYCQQCSLHAKQVLETEARAGRLALIAEPSRGAGAPEVVTRIFSPDFRLQDDFFRQFIKAPPTIVTTDTTTHLRKLFVYYRLKDISSEIHQSTTNNSHDGYHYTPEELCWYITD